MRVVVLGRGAAGKSTFSSSLATATGVACVELDRLFWNPHLEPMEPERWVEVQRDLVAEEAWILDGDLGPHDGVDVRLARADTVVVFDPPARLCVWRTLRRSRERLDYWRWLLRWRRRYLPALIEPIAEHRQVTVLIVRNRHDLAQVTSRLAVSRGDD